MESIEEVEVRDRGGQERFIDVKEKVQIEKQRATSARITMQCDTK